MKRMMFFAMVLLMSLASFAQEKKSNEEFFLGKWQLMVEGLPTGDVEMQLAVNKDDNGGLQGTVKLLDGSESVNPAEVKMKGNTLMINFSAGDVDIPINLDKEGESSLVGRMFDMFEVSGKRLVD